MRVVVGGHARNIGKTSVLCALVGRFRALHWTAVKITQYGHGICSRDGRRCDCAPGEHPFLLSEEGDARGRGDTCRFLAAGARRSLWLRVRQGQMGEAFPTFEKAIEGDDWVAIESNSVLEFLAPALYLSVLDPAVSDFKASAARFLSRADALVTVNSTLAAGAWPGLDFRKFTRKPVFPVAAPDYFGPDLARFIRRRLGLGTPSSNPIATQERSWPR